MLLSGVFCHTRKLGEQLSSVGQKRLASRTAYPVVTAMICSLASSLQCPMAKKRARANVSKTAQPPRQLPSTIRCTIVVDPSTLPFHVMHFCVSATLSHPLSGQAPVNWEAVFRPALAANVTGLRSSLVINLVIIVRCD